MAPYQATAEIFMTAFKALPVRERSTFLTKLLQDNSLREDIMDIAVERLVFFNKNRIIEHCKAEGCDFDIDDKRDPYQQ